MRPEALLNRLLSGSFTKISFAKARRLVAALGFEELRVKGSHHVDGGAGIAEQLNLQDRDGHAKPYQLRQLVVLVRRYHLGIEDHNHAISVFWSAEDGAWIADVPDLAYCSATGDTPHDAVAEVETAISAWLEAAQSSGRPIPVPSASRAQA